MVFVSLPFVAWFAVMPQAFVRLVYERGSFTAQATVEVAAALAFFAVGLAFANANIMFNRAFQSMQRPLLPMYVSFGNLAVNALLCWLLYKPSGGGDHAQHGDRLGGQLLRALLAAAPARRAYRRPQNGRRSRRSPCLRRRPGGRSVRRVAGAGRIRRRRVRAAARGGRWPPSPPARASTSAWRRCSSSKSSPPCGASSGAAAPAGPVGGGVGRPGRPCGARAPRARRPGDRLARSLYHWRS